MMNEGSLLLLDPAIVTRNLGDEIISHAVREELATILPSFRIFSSGTHELGGARTHRLMQQVDGIILGGSNLLGRHFWRNRQLKTLPLPGFARHRCIAMGAGWVRGVPRFPRVDNWVLGQLLHPSANHSVRDGLALTNLVQFTGLLATNTTCPTLWTLGNSDPPPRLAAVDEVLVAPNRKRDPVDFIRGHVRRLSADFRHVHIWSQSTGDTRQLDDLVQSLSNVSFVEPTLRSYQELLADHDRSIGYFGTRLHGGIEALRHGRPAIIVQVDHRAAAMADSIDLPVVSVETATHGYANVVDRTFPGISVPADGILQWKQDLKRTLASS